MVGDRGRPPERPEDQGQQTSRRDSRSPSRSRERLEQMRREGGMSSDQQENLRRANETLLDRLRPHLTQGFLSHLEEDPLGHRQVPPLHIINHVLNAIDETMNMSVMERRESNQRLIDHAPDEDRHRFNMLLLRDEMDHLRARGNEIPAMEHLDELLPWEGHLPTEWRQSEHIIMVFGPGMHQIREQTENMPEAERHEIRRTWLNRIPAQYRERLARFLGEFNPDQQRLILRDRIQGLMGLDDDRHRQVEWRNIKADREGISAYITPEIEEWRRNQRAAIDDQEMEIWEEVDRGSRPEQELSDFRNRSTSEYTLPGSQGKRESLLI